MEEARTSAPNLLRFCEVRGECVLWIVRQSLVPDPVLSLEIIRVPFTLFAFLSAGLFQPLVSFYVFVSRKVAVVVKA